MAVGALVLDAIGSAVHQRPHTAAREVSASVVYQDGFPEYPCDAGVTVPEGVASDGTDMWVTNEYGETVTEVNAATGKFVQLIKGPQYRFGAPGYVLVVGTHVWVASNGGGPGERGDLTEFDASTGKLVRVLIN